MLFGTDLSNAYASDYNEPVNKPLPLQNNNTPPKQEPVATKHEVNNNQHMDPNFLTADQKLYLLSAQLQQQRETFDGAKGTGYIDKLLSKKKDIMKLVVITMVVLLAMSVHWFACHYLKKYLEDAMLGEGKEFLVRLMYPALVLLLLWNMKVFSK
jgi:hypothetical protein